METGFFQHNWVDEWIDNRDEKQANNGEDDVDNVLMSVVEQSSLVEG